MLLDTSPHVAFALLVPADVFARGTQSPKQAADQVHHLPVRAVIAVDDRFLDVLVPPLAEVTHSRVLEQELAKALMGRNEGSDLDPDRRAVHRGVLIVRVGSGGHCLGDGVVLARRCLKDVVDRMIHEVDFRAWVLEGESDGLEFRGELGEWADQVEGEPCRGKGGGG